MNLFHLFIGTIQEIWYIKYTFLLEVTISKVMYVGIIDDECIFSKED